MLSLHRAIASKGTESSWEQKAEHRDNHIKLDSLQGMHCNGAALLKTSAQRNNKAQMMMLQLLGSFTGTQARQPVLHLHGNRLICNITILHPIEQPDEPHLCHNCTLAYRNSQQHEPHQRDRSPPPSDPPASELPQRRPCSRSSCLRGSCRRDGGPKSRSRLPAAPRRRGVSRISG